MQHTRTTGSVLVLLLAMASVPALASIGDESHEFKLCTNHCLHTGCTLPPVATSSGGAGDGEQRCSSVCAARSGATQAAAASVVPALRLWRWDCAADCSYLCMWQLEDAAAAAGLRGARKYHGKWPFERWGGMQEPASVAFSAANLAVHAAGLSHFLALRQRLLLLCCGGGGGSSGDVSAGAAAAAAAAAAYPWAWAVVVGGGLSMNAWLWSATFHGRDTWVGEGARQGAAATAAGEGAAGCCRALAAQLARAPAPPPPLPAGDRAPGLPVG